MTTKKEEQMARVDGQVDGQTVTPPERATAPTSEAIRTTADVLNRAAEIVERGWCQGDYFKGDTCCLIGAIVSAACPDPQERDWGVVGRVAVAYRDVLAAVTGTTVPHMWNDQPGRTQAEVAAKLREAAKLAEAESTHA